jgi:RimJ/RimL family protein N-acetyltransferase
MESLRIFQGGGQSFPIGPGIHHIPDRRPEAFYKIFRRFSLKPPEKFDTARLILRIPILQDAEPIFNNYANDKLVTRYLHWYPHETIEMTKTFLKRCINVWKAGTAFPWVITLKESQEVIGMIELRIDEHRADIGYVLARKYWDRGFAPEAAQLVLDWTIAQPTICRVWAVCDVDNYASARVLEKIGMEREGILRRWLFHPNIDKKPRDCFSYSLVK